MSSSKSFVKTLAPLLTREEEISLFERWREARENGNSREENRLFQQIVIQFSPIIKKLVKKMKGYKLDPDDLTSEALLALTKAVIDFDPEMGNRFGTYASNCIINTLYTYITKQYFITNVCANSQNKKLFFGLRRIMGEQIQEGEDRAELSMDMAKHMAEKLNVSTDVVFRMHSVLREPYHSLNETIHNEEESITKQDLLQSNFILAKDKVEKEQLFVLQNKLLYEAIQTLDNRSQVILVEQTLREPNEGKTLEQLGDQFSISKERARQIREQAKENVAKHIKKQLGINSLKPNDIFG